MANLSPKLAKHLCGELRDFREPFTTLSPKKVQNGVEFAAWGFVLVVFLISCAA